MSARAIGSGTISFGLVSIPVKIYAASQPAATVSFHLLHGKCGSRLRQQLVCPNEKEVVDRKDAVKGYEFAKGQFVTFTPEELSALEEEPTERIEIAEFVPEAKVDPIYFDRAYYLGPDKGGEKAYLLLIEAMRKTGRGALARWAARGKQYLALLRVEGRGLVLQQLHHADEVRSVTEVPIPEAEVRQPELDLAVKLVEQVASEEFHPEAYANDVKVRMKEAIQQKVEGKQITASPTEAPRGQIIDLMEALKASLEAKGAAAPAVRRTSRKRSPTRSAGGR